MKLVGFQLTTGKAVLVNPEQVSSVHEGLEPEAATIVMVNGRSFDVKMPQQQTGQKLQGGG